MPCVAPVISRYLSPLVASVLLCDTCWSKPSCSNSSAQELLPADPAVPVLRARQRSLAECSSCLARQLQHQHPLSPPRDLEEAVHDIGHCPHLRSAYVRDMTCRLREREFDQASGHLPGVYGLAWESVGHNHHGHPFWKPYRHQD